MEPDYWGGGQAHPVGLLGRPVVPPALPVPTPLVCGPLPPYVHLGPPDVIHVVKVPGPSLFFATLPLPCIILNTN